MKRAIYLFAVAVMAMGFAACSNDNSPEEAIDTAEQNLELRAAALGYTDAESYQASVAAQCAAGNHENCCILADGTHLVCPHVEHSGTKHDGTHHNGNDHGTHGSNGHSQNNGNGHHH